MGFEATTHSSGSTIYCVNGCLQDYTLGGGTYHIHGLFGGQLWTFVCFVTHSFGGTQRSKRRVTPLYLRTRVFFTLCYTTGTIFSFLQRSFTCRGTMFFARVFYCFVVGTVTYRAGNVRLTRATLTSGHRVHNTTSSVSGGHSHKLRKVGPHARDNTGELLRGTGKPYTHKGRGKGGHTPFGVHNGHQGHNGGPKLGGTFFSCFICGGTRRLRNG